MGGHENGHPVGDWHDLLNLPDHDKKALNKVEGVENIEVSFEKKEALVTFDDAKTTVEALLEATKNAGYPSSVHP